MMFGKRLLDELAAWSLQRSADRLDHVLCDKKRLFFSRATGVVLEVGAGTGLNARYFQKSCQLILSEPNAFLREIARARVGDIRCFSGENIVLDDSSTDTIISTLLLCSVKRIDVLLTEFARVLRPGGVYIFIEHVGAASGTSLRLFQNLSSPLCRLFDGGCRPNRDIESAIRQHPDFCVTDIEHFEIDIGAPLVKHFVAGIAQKKGK